METTDPQDLHNGWKSRERPVGGFNAVNWHAAFRYALANSPSAVMVLDSAGHILFVNQAFERLSGRSDSAIQSCSPADVYRICSTNLALREAWKTERAGETWSAQVELFRDAREAICVTFFMNPVIGDSGEIEGFVCIQQKAASEGELYQEIRAQQEAIDVYNKLVETYTSQLRQAMNKLDRTFLFAVHALTAALDARDPYTAGHSLRVSHNACLLASQLEECTQTDIETIHIGALLHDIGKIGVPDAVLRKPAALTLDEYEMVKLHPVIGHNILSGLPDFEGALAIIRSHHERLDGSGYPDGLKADQIPTPVRCVSIADVFDALTSARPYRDSVDVRAAIQTLRSEASQGWWDPKLVEQFATLHQNGLIALSSDDALPETYLETFRLAA